MNDTYTHNEKKNINTKDDKNATNILREISEKSNRI